MVNKTIGRVTCFPLDWWERETRGGRASFLEECAALSNITPSSSPVSLSLVRISSMYTSIKACKQTVKPSLKNTLPATSFGDDHISPTFI